MLDPLNWFCIPLNGSWPWGLKPGSQGDFTPGFLKFRMQRRDLTLRVFFHSTQSRCFLYLRFILLTFLWGQDEATKSKRFRILPSQLFSYQYNPTALPNDIKLFSVPKSLQENKIPFPWELVLYLTNCQLGSDYFFPIKFLGYQIIPEETFQKWVTLKGDTFRPIRDGVPFLGANTNNNNPFSII